MIKNKPTTLLLWTWMAEKERFELSRRLMPAYTLSRGASSANLSTSPYLTSPPFLRTCLTIIPHFGAFVNIFFDLFGDFGNFQ